MSWRALLFSILMATVWTCAALFTLRSPAPAPRTFAVFNERGVEPLTVTADEVRIEGFCTVFLRGGQRIAATCGQHWWSEYAEIE